MVLLVGGRRRFLQGDVRPQGGQVTHRVLVAPLYVVDVPDAGGPVGDEPRHQQGGPAPQVRGPVGEPG